MKAYEYCVQWLPLDNIFLTNCVFVDFHKQAEVCFSHIEETIGCFKRVYEGILNDPTLLDSVEEQFLDFQGMCETDIPRNIWEAAQIGDIQDKQYRMDVIWGYLKSKLPLPGKIALSVLVIPHSNAGEERVFSTIRKNKTEFRSQLQLGGSLNAIMRIKMSIPRELLPCYKWKPSNELLKKCKSATRLYNEDHSSKDQ
jgi:hypothetical protein